MEKIKNIKLYTSSIAKIAVNTTLLVAPYAVATGAAILYTPFLEKGETMFIDKLEYPALVRETINSDGEIYSEVTYVHPREAKYVDDTSIIRVSYPWEQKLEGYERLQEEYKFVGNDILKIHSVITNKNNAIYLKNELELLNSIKQTATQISDTNEIEFEIKTSKVDRDDYLVIRENEKDNNFALFTTVAFGILFNVIAQSLLPYKWNANKKEEIKEAKALIKKR
jgi:hypothetical protein